MILWNPACPFWAAAASPLLLSSHFKGHHCHSSGQAFICVCTHTYACQSPKGTAFFKELDQFRVVFCFPFWVSSSPHQLLTPGWKERRSLRNKSCLKFYCHKLDAWLWWNSLKREALRKWKFLHKKIVQGRFPEMFGCFYSPSPPFHEVLMMACHKIAQKLDCPIVFWASANTQHQF